MTEDVKPEYYYGKISRDTCFMICSDGLVHKISSKELAEAFEPTVLSNKSALQAAIINAISLVKERKETDNISCVAIKAVQSNKN